MAAILDDDNEKNKATPEPMSAQFIDCCLEFPYKLTWKLGED